MEIALGILIFLGVFSFMEFMAWFTHKYVMHGFLWSLHKDHHKKDHDSWFERNDAFFIFYAVLSMSFSSCWHPIPIFGMAGPSVSALWPMGPLIFWFMTFSFTNVSKCLEMRIIGMPRG